MEARAPNILSGEESREAMLADGFGPMSAGRLLDGREHNDFPEVIR
ncbi:hypothetical protein [Methylocella tundrae]|nr:hypothetical protein [Methylocella tundrae]